MSIYTLCILFILLATSCSSPINKEDAETTDEYRLPNVLQPTNYDISLTFSKGAFSLMHSEYIGTVKIEFVANETTTLLKLHAANDFITINSLTFNSYVMAKEDYSIVSKTSILTINIENAVNGGLTPGNKYTLTIEYTGKISTSDMYGIYKSSYVDSTSNDTSYLITTQFEPVYARRAFPCFDEPSFKAVFNLVVVYPTGLDLNVLFNTEAKGDPVPSDNEEYYTVTFNPTPKMSSYLVALAISDFTSTNGTNVEDTKVPYTVWSQEDLKASRTFAVNIGPKILQKLNDYTGYNYSQDSSKMDQIAIPDFAAGAMENWGLVTYRESALLWDENQSSNRAKQSVATIIAHEFAHQWFGNLITCNWWSETFLNEGFATYFEYFIANEVDELASWKLDKQFVSSVLQQVLVTDSLENAQALQSNASTPMEISNKFGSITYSKGGSILHMVSHIMGENNFKKGIQAYLSSELQHGTAVPSNLWTILQKSVNSQVSDLPDKATLDTVMENWVTKPGYPLLKVTIEGKNLKISQERFLSSGEDKDSKWYVPISYAESSNEAKFQITSPAQWLTPSDTEKVIALDYDNDYVLLNTLQTAYYRVNYDSGLWENISVALQKDNFDDIPDLNRAQIVDDAFNLAKTDKLLYSKTFQIIEFLKNDISYFSWVPAFKGFSYILQKLSDKTDLKIALQTHIRTFMKLLYASVPISESKDDDQIYTLTQVLAGEWACSLEEETCVQEAKDLFGVYKASGAKPNKNLKSIVYCNGLRYSNDSADWDFLRTAYSQATSASEKSTILLALGCTTNTSKLSEYLGETISDNSEVRSQDALSIFASVYSNSMGGVNVALDFFITNYPKISEKYTSLNAKSSLILGIAGRLTSEEQVTKLKNFIAATDDFSNELNQTAAAATEQAEANVAWIKNYKDDLEEYYGISDDSDDDNPNNGAESAKLSYVVLTLLGVVAFLALHLR